MGPGVVGGAAQTDRLAQALQSPGPAIVFWALTCTVLALFRGFPAIDIDLSRLFLSITPCAGAKLAPAAGLMAEACGRFPVADLVAARMLRDALQMLPIAAALCVALLLVARRVCGVRALGYSTYRAGIDALVSLALGPGLLVNVILKDHWGRPRPVQTEIFGGSFPFVPAGEISTFCSRNCSFVSGEASAAFWLICLVPMVPVPYRRAALVCVLGLAITTSALRLAFGAHYLSDVVLAGFLTLTVHALVTTSTAFARPHHAAQLAENAAA